MEKRLGRYYVSSFMRKMGFRESGKPIKQIYGTSYNEWIKGNLKVNRKQVNGSTFLIVSVIGKQRIEFNISNKNENRDHEILKFEETIKYYMEAKIMDQKQAELKEKELNEDLIEVLKDVQHKAADCIEALEAGKALDEMQQIFLRSLL